MKKIKNRFLMPIIILLCCFCVTNIISAQSNKKTLLEKKIIKNGDTDAYNQYRKIATFEDILYSMFMANTYQYPIAHSDVYYHLMNMQRRIYDNTMDSISLALAFDFVCRGATLNDSVSKAILINALEGNFPNNEPGNVAAKQRLAQDFFHQRYLMHDNEKGQLNFFEEWYNGDSAKMFLWWELIQYTYENAPLFPVNIPVAQPSLSLPTILEK